MFNIVKKEDKKFFILLCILLIFITSLPVIYGYWVAPAGYKFLGYSVFHSADQPQYLAYIRQAAEGNFLFENRYTTEKLHKLFFHPFFLFLGLLVWITGLPSIFWYQLARIILLPFVLLSIYEFMFVYFNSSRQRKFAMVYVATGSGLGWLSLTLLAKYNPYTISLDFHQIEAVAFMSIYSFPLHSLGLLLLLRAFISMRNCLWKSSTPIFTKNEQIIYKDSAANSLFEFYNKLNIFFDRKSLAFRAGLWTLLLTLIHPYDAVIPAAILPFVVILAGNKPKINFRTKLGVIVRFWSIAIWGFLYYASIISIDPIINRWAKQITMQTRSWWYYLPGYGLLLPLALLGIFLQYKHKKLEKQRIFLWLWPLCVLLLIELPFSFQNRLIQGVQIPLVVSATLALWWLFSKVRPFFSYLKRPFYKQIIIICFLIFTSFSNICIIVSDISDYHEKVSGLFIDPAHLGAYEWLEQNSLPNNIVLTSLPSGNPIPYLAGNKVYIGHLFSTINSYAKAASVRAFFKDNKTQTARQHFLKREKIKYILCDETTRHYGNFNPNKVKWLKLVFKSGKVQLFKTEFSF